MTRILMSLLAVTVLATTATVRAETRQLDAHEHGAATLEIVIDDGRLYLSLHSPAVNLVGFEHLPRNAEDRQRVDQAIQTLEAAEGIFRFDSSAGCRLDTARVLTTLAPDSEHAEHDEDTAHDEHAEHADFESEWAFTCTQIDSLASIGIGLFDAFDGFDEIRAIVVGPGGQTAHDLTAQNTVIEL